MAPRRWLIVGLPTLLCWAGCAATGTGPAAARSDTPVAAASASALDRAALLATVCSGCHAEGGSAIVSLQAHAAADIERLLRAYRDAADGPSAMHRMARGYSDADIAAIAMRVGKPPASP